MTGLLLKASARFYLRHPWQLALAIAGIALGVAVYVGVDLASDSAERAFELSADAVNGRTTHRLLPLGGDLPEGVFRDLVTRRGITDAAPVIETDVGLASDPGRRLVLLGVDPVKEPAVRGFVGFVPGSTEDAVRLMERPDSVLLPESLAAELELDRGGALELEVDGKTARVTVAGFVRSEDSGSQAGTPIVADISTAQTLTGRLGRIDRIDLRLDAAAAAKLASDPPPGTALVDAGGARGFNELARAFRTNLTALGLLALVVGMFLIYSTMSFAIVQRRAVVGTLIAIGLERGRLLGSVLLEALAIGGLATALGIALGHLLAQGLVHLVLRTIGDFYYSNAVQGASASPWVYARGAGLGVVATLVAALGPARDAARSPPDAAIRRAALEKRTRARARLAAWLAPVALLLGLGLIRVDPRGLFAAFAGLFGVLAAGALATPAATAALMRVAEPLAARGFGLAGVLAVRGVTASLSRTGVATAALAVAVATVIGIGLMISSFRSSLEDWLHTTLTADLYVSFDERAGGGAGADLAAAIAGLRGVDGVSLTEFARLPTDDGPLGLRAVSPGSKGWGLDIVEGDGGSALRALESEDVVAVSEPYAFRRRLHVGDELTLPTPSGPRAFPIVAVYRDYNTGGAAVTLSLERYRRIWSDPGVAGIGVDVADGADAKAVQASIAAHLPPGARMRSNAGLVDLSLVIFDRTFKITDVLRILAALVAFLGVLSALLSIELEKTRELAVLRAIGFAPAELGRLVLTQTTLLGASAGLAAVPIGALLAALLVRVINRRSFGWSMELAFAPAPIAAGVALAIGAAALAGIYPALRIARVSLAGSLREE
ncbi:MAG TPA: FtsX-like permease family protein [Gammaproteobacteria bacterium]|nr:FtsX-like permease family protein [Gammaproteobacteria bacterium]